MEDITNVKVISKLTWTLWVFNDTDQLLHGLLPDLY